MKVNFSHKKIAVLGFGAEGKSAADFLLRQKADVAIFDEKKENEFDGDLIKEYKDKGINFFFGPFPIFEDFQFIIRSPGVPISHKRIKEVKEKGVEVTSLTKLFFVLCPGKIIGVTGTKGKGTTATLIYEMLKEQEIDAYLGGNIGLPPLEFLNKLTEDSWAVLELSSFQLQDLIISPHIAVLLMITSEHLDYHKDTKEYIDAKRNIVRFQNENDFAVMNWDYPASHESDIHTEAKIYHVSREQKVRKGCFIGKNTVIRFIDGKEEKIVDEKEILLPGGHNLENVCAAVVAATLVGVEKKHIVKVLKSFRGLEHRLEFVKTVKGVDYYNDSFSTTPETAAAAIEAFEKPKIIILGGSSKGSDFTHLGKIISNPKSNVKAIIGIGVEWPKIKLKIENLKLKIVEGKKNMHEIVEEASKLATPGDIVLLSPACASFGMFKNYKDRGLQFKSEVNRL